MVVVVRVRLVERVDAVEEGLALVVVFGVARYWNMVTWHLKDDIAGLSAGSACSISPSSKATSEASFSCTGFDLRVGGIERALIMTSKLRGSQLGFKAPECEIRGVALR